MDIPSKQVYEILQNAGVDSIHHANSVVTACEFIREQSLLSRGTVERMGFHQTAQSSDGLDKRYGIWFDVFADSVDIHERAGRENAYGPVLFVLDSKIIENTYTGRLWVTKQNPTKWAGKKDKDRWFQSKQDLEDNFVYGTFDQMIVFRHCGGSLPFGKYLKEIIVDDPEIESEAGVDFFSMAVGALRYAMSQSGTSVPIVKRECAATCTCVATYQANHELARKMFDPKI